MMYDKKSEYIKVSNFDKGPALNLVRSQLGLSSVKYILDRFLGKSSSKKTYIIWSC